MAITWDTSWMWHPDFTESHPNTAGLFVHFRRDLFISETPPTALHICITADTKYRLYINNSFVGFGPIKGDQNLWFFDEIDIAPFLKPGRNVIGVHVLRFFYATSYAPSFPRLPSGGVRIVVPGDDDESLKEALQSSTAWETAVDKRTVLRVDQPEDHFLHVYEASVRSEDTSTALSWVPATLLQHKSSTGNSPPWQLSPRLIPPARRSRTCFTAVHNVQSTVATDQWIAGLTANLPGQAGKGVHLPAGSKHMLDLEVTHHTTAFLCFTFKRPGKGGSIVKITYSESYESEPELVPWSRNKANRCDYTKGLFGPTDVYELDGRDSATRLGYYADEEDIEVFAPFHYRTFRFLRLEIEVSSSGLLFLGIDIEAVEYPLEIHASFEPPGNSISRQLWQTSIRTLQNCMHDCYEDCPFYEQLQYAMDTRSSALFTYYVSGDDRLARQAIAQIHRSFQARLGLTQSRAPTHKPQFIPHFSLFWCCMVCDHLEYFHDKPFAAQFIPVVDAVLAYFQAHIDTTLGLVRSERRPGIWNFVDWAESWKPHGIPPAIEHTGISTFTNQLYAYTLQKSATLLQVISRDSISSEYRDRAAQILTSLQTHCFDGEFFSDSLASAATPADYSQHCQTWAVLCGAVTGPDAQDLLTRGMSIQASAEKKSFTKESIAMSFYRMRALSAAGGTLYNTHFHAFWDPWCHQLESNMTTWVEDDVCQRSDCHAWGSVPIFEFLAEVAGVTPALPGWAAITFSPRVSLYSRLEATVPLRMVGGESEGAVRVSWGTKVSGDVEVRLTLRLLLDRELPVHVCLPGCAETWMDMRSGEKVFTVPVGALQSFFMKTGSTRAC